MSRVHSRPAEEKLLEFRIVFAIRWCQDFNDEVRYASNSSLSDDAIFRQHNDKVRLHDIDVAQLKINRRIDYLAKLWQLNLLIKLELNMSRNGLMA